MWKDIVKKNAISIACGVVALIAIIAAFFPADGWVEQLQANLDARKSVNSTLEGLNNKRRHLPNLNPNATEAVELTSFPSETIIDAGQKATGQMKEVSGKLFETAVRINFHPLLVPNSLPKPRDLQKLEFRGAYAQAMKFLRDGQVAEVNIPISILGGIQPPTPDQISYAQSKLWVDKYAAKIVTINGTPANYDQILNDWTTEALKLPDVMKDQTAQQHKIYIMPGALTESTAVGGSGVPNEDDIWYAQLSLWIQQDIAGAIAATNANSERGILSAPVKQLVQLNVPIGQNTGGSAGTGRFGAMPPGMPGMMPGAGGEDPAAAAAAGVVSDPAAQLTPNFINTPTGRVASGLYDVHDFVLTVDVEAAQLPLLINELTRDRYVAIHSVNMMPVDVNALTTGGFMYGGQPVVRAVLQGEILYLRKWTEAFMPPGVKRSLNIAEPAPVPAQ